MKQLWVNADTKHSTLVQLPCGQVAVYSRRKPGASINEDAALVLPVDDQRVVLAVADGCGGMSGGADAARLTLKALQHSVRRISGSLRSAILDGIEAANAKVIRLGVGAATTLAVAEVDGVKFRSYHIGDSQIVLAGGRGKIKLQTTAHSPVGYAVEAGVMSDVEAMTHEDRHIVSNVVGSSECSIEVGMRQKLAKRDTLVIASDGIFDNLHIDEISNTISNGNLINAASSLAERTDDRINSESEASPSKPDDATFILFRRG